MIATMSHITSKEIDSLREAQEQYMPQRVKIRRRHWFGDDESEYVDHKLNVPAVITAGYGVWRMVADQFSGITAFTIGVPWDTDVQAGDLIVDEKSRGFEVRDVKSPNTYQSRKVVLCDNVTEGVDDG